MRTLTLLVLVGCASEIELVPGPSGFGVAPGAVELDLRAAGDCEEASLLVQGDAVLTQIAFLPADGVSTDAVDVPSVSGLDLRGGIEVTVTVCRTVVPVEGELWFVPAVGEPEIVWLGPR